MSRPLRPQFPGSIWHITVRGNEKRTTFLDDDDRRQFLTFLDETVRRHDWLLLAYVLMSNHFHFVVELTRETLSKGMHWLDGQYARRFNRRHDRVGHLFQARFKSILIHEETYLREVLRYVVLNPVRAKMVRRPENHLWSSYHATAGLVETPKWLATERALQVFAPEPVVAREDYSRFVEAGISGTRCPFDEKVGIYLGSKEWIERVRVHIAAKPRSDEHRRDHVRPLQKSMSEIIQAVAATFDVSENVARLDRGGAPRMMAAWLGRYEADHDLRSIAAALRLRSMSQASNLIAQCDRTLSENGELRSMADRCTSALSSV